MKKIIYIFLLCMFSITGYCYGNNLMLNQNFPPAGTDPLAPPFELAITCLLPGAVDAIRQDSVVVEARGGTVMIAFDTYDTDNIIAPHYLGNNIIGGNLIPSYYSQLVGKLSECGLSYQSVYIVPAAPSQHIHEWTLPGGGFDPPVIIDPPTQTQNFRVELTVGVSRNNSDFKRRIQIKSGFGGGTCVGRLIVQKEAVGECQVGNGGYDIRHRFASNGGLIKNGFIDVHNTLEGEQYTLYHNNTQIASQTSSADDSIITFNITPQEGQYYVKNGGTIIRGCVIYSEYVFLHEDVLHPVDNNGFTKLSRYGGINKIRFNYDSGFVMSEFETYIDMISMNQVPLSVSSVPMRLSVENHSGNSFDLQIEYGPNTGDTYNVFALPIKFNNNNPVIYCNQPSNGTIRKYPVTFSINESGNQNNVSLILTNSQPMVTYKLYETSRVNSSYRLYITEQLGTGQEIRFDNVSAPKMYAIYGFYEGEEYFVGDVDITTLTPMTDVAGNNWITATTYTQPNSNNPLATNIVDKTYYDGLGEAVQSVSRMASPAGKDVVQPVYYDYMRRSDTQAYLPYSTTNVDGRIVENPYATERYVANYNTDEASYAFSQKEYEASPLGRVMKTTNVGSAFIENDKSVIYSYTTNSASDAVYRIEHDITTKAAMVNGFYPANSLRRTEVVNEDGAQMIEFVDAKGHTVLQRTINDNGERIDTYSVYDVFGRLAWVISPEGAKLLGPSAVFSDYTLLPYYPYSYVYIYDARGRVIEKKIPDKDFEYYVYDKLDRVVMSQDGNERRVSNRMMVRPDRWKRTTYDNLNRIVNQEELKFPSISSVTREMLQSTYDNGTLLSVGAPTITTLAEYDYYDNDDAFGQNTDNRIPVVSDMFLVEPKTTQPVFIGLMTYASVDPNGIFFSGVNIRPEYKICETSSASYYYIPEEIRQALVSNTTLNTRFNYTSTFPLDESMRVDYVDATDETRYYKNFSQYTFVIERSGAFGEFVIDDPEGKYFNHPDFDKYLLSQTTFGRLTTYIYAIPQSDWEDGSFQTAYDATYQASIRLGKGGGIIYPSMSIGTTADIPTGTEYLMGYMASGNEQQVEEEYDPMLQFEDVEDMVSADDVNYDRNIGAKKYEKIAIFADGDTQFVERMFYYDKKGRLVQTVERNHLGGISRYSNKYDFVGNVLASHESHQKAVDFEGYDTKTTEFVYDHRGRMLHEIISVSGSVSPSITTYYYNELGQLIAKDYTGDGQGFYYGGENFSYNIQGWLKTYGNDFYSAMLSYYDTRIPNSQPSYTGNITEWFEGHTNYSGSNFMNFYQYDYDKLGRLKGYNNRFALNSSPTDIYTEQGINYDANGNILHLTRYDGNGVLTDYNYQYSGNRLTNLNGNAYTYDANGNMTHDGMRGVDLEYNSLNLIRKVKQGNTANATYRWLADGTKAGVVDNNGNGFEYLGSFVYQRDVSGLNLESVGFSNGRFVASSTGEMTPYYQITDHLGSVRTVINKSIEVVAQNNYYAFGLRHENPNLAQHTANRYLYNGKEEQTTGGVDLLDYGARMYDATLGRWHSVDPMATNYTNYSPYVYCANNPIRMIDPNGMYFVGALEELDKYKTTIYNRIFDNNQKIRELRREQFFARMNNNVDGRMKIDAQISMYSQDNDYMQTIQQEISVLEDSKQGYNIAIDNTLGNNGAFTFNFQNGIAQITLGVQSVDLIAHELKHAYQFEIGRMSVANNETGGGPLFLYDQYDEVRAYERGALFGGPLKTPADIAADTNYGQTEPRPVDFRNFPAVTTPLMINNKTGLQNVANYYNAAFRVGGETYYPNKK